MSLNIKSERAEVAIRELAAATGESLTEAIQKAAEERLARISTSRNRDKARSLMERLRPLQEIVAVERKRRRDTRTAKQIMDELYDDHGLPR
jgi:antitoxin VapB